MQTNFLKDYPKFKTQFLLEFDRKGYGAVYYHTKNEEFQRLINYNFDTITETGSVSDISAFQTKRNINAANIGIGYDKQHSTNEIQHWEYMLQVIEKTKQLLDNRSLTHRLSILEYTKPTPAPIVTKQYKDWDQTSYNWDTNKKETKTKTKKTEQITQEYGQTKQTLINMGWSVYNTWDYTVEKGYNAEVELSLDLPGAEEITIEICYEEKGQGAYHTLTKGESVITIAELKNLLPKTEFEIVIPFMYKTRNNMQILSEYWDNEETDTWYKY